MSKDYFHARWINTLSYMEHIGSRKIIKSQDSQLIGLFTLQHISEEARHACFLKKLGDRHFPSICPTFEPQYLLGGPAASCYFQSLDVFLEEKLKKEKEASLLNYLYMTLLVEERAMEVYTLYQRFLREKQISLHLRPLLAEEELHLQETSHLLKKRDTLFSSRRKEWKIFENQLFLNFLMAIENDLTNSF